VVLSFRFELADALVLYGTVFAFFRLAPVEAEALVWHHGREGVAIACARETLNAGEPRVQRLHDWLVRLLAERSYDLLCRVDVGTGYAVAAIWASRPGQMIIRPTEPGLAPTLQNAGGSAPRSGAQSAPQG
jgi:hypothetical protein